MFLQVSVIHSVQRGGSASVHAGIPPQRDQADPPWSRPPPEPGRHPPRTRQTPRSRHPPGTRQTPRDKADPPGTRQTPRNQADPPGTRQPPPGPDRPPRDQADPPRSRLHKYGLRAAGTHPTGMHSCVKCFWRYDHVSNRLTDSLMRIQREKNFYTYSSPPYFRNWHMLPTVVSLLYKKNTEQVVYRST